MSSRARLRLFVYFGVVTLAGTAACNLVVSSGDYVADLKDSGVVSSDGASATETSDDTSVTTDAPIVTEASTDSVSAETDGSSCWDPTGLAGRPCWKCAATNKTQLENACTSASSFYYDNSGLPMFDGGLPFPEAGADSASDVAATDAGATDAAATDASATDASPTDAATDAGAPPPACSSLTGGNVIYAVGSSAVGLFLGQIAQRLENDTPAVTVVYQPAGSCVGVKTMINGTLLTGTATYWDSNLSIDPTTKAGQHSCTLDPAGVAPDIGFSDVFAESCGYSFPTGFPAYLSNDFGPIQTMEMVVSVGAAATIKAISYEAARLVFGFGGATGFAVDPWTNSNYYFIRKPTSGTETMIGAAIELPTSLWLGLQQPDSPTVVSKLIAAGGSSTPDRAIGILSADFADANSSQLRVLAYQDKGQSAGFLPDSAKGATDKANVRDGHYPIWGPLHMFAHLVAGSPKPAVQKLENVISGTITLGTLDIISIYASNSLVPQCAMRVTRTNDGGDITPAPPAKSCECKYLKATGSVVPSTCVPCSKPTDCTGGTSCTFDYCQ